MFYLLPPPFLSHTSPFPSLGAAALCPQEVPSDEPDQLVVPHPDSPYASLGEVEPVNLISFAYQIASGMVSKHTPS